MEPEVVSPQLPQAATMPPIPQQLTASAPAVSQPQPRQQTVNKPVPQQLPGQLMVEGSDIDLQHSEPAPQPRQPFHVQNPVFAQQSQQAQPYPPANLQLSPAQPQRPTHPLFQQQGSQQQALQQPQPLQQPTMGAPITQPSGMQPQAAPQQPVSPQAQVQQMPRAPAAGAGSLPGKSSARLLIKIAIIVTGLLVVIGLAVVARSLLSSPKSVGELVSDSQEGISFLRPDTWSKSVIEDEFVYYTEGGADINDSDRGILLGSDFIGIRFESLGENQKDTIKESFETQFTSAEAFFTSDSCTDVGDNKTVELQQNGYDIAYLIEASCSRTSTDEPGGTVKMFIGWTDVDLHLFGVVADTDTWENDIEVLNQIIQSVRPSDT